MFALTANKVHLYLTEGEKITSGSRKIYLCKFNFSSDWDGVHKTAVFSSRWAEKGQILNEDNTCEIPYEVIERPCAAVYVGVYGTKNGELVMPTELVNLGEVECGTRLGEMSTPPTPELYDQILAAANQAVETANRAEDSSKQAVNVAIDSRDSAQDSARIAAQSERNAAAAAQKTESDAKAAQEAQKTASADAKTAADAAASAVLEAKAAEKSAEEARETLVAVEEARDETIAQRVKLIGQETVYQASASGTTVPIGDWQPQVPDVPQGQYLWTRTTMNFNIGEPVVSYITTRHGADGETPYIGENGNWWIDGKDTGFSSLGKGVPSGGKPGDTLVKQSEIEGDTVWKNTNATNTEILIMLSDLGLLPAATSDGAILTDENGSILLW